MSRTSRTCPSQARSSRNSRAPSAPTAARGLLPRHRRGERDLVAAGRALDLPRRRGGSTANSPAASPPARARGTVIVARPRAAARRRRRRSSCRWLRTSLWPSITGRMRAAYDPGENRSLAPPSGRVAGLADLLGAPGPDLRYLVGYKPPSPPSGSDAPRGPARPRPVIVLPAARREDAEGADVTFLESSGRQNPYAAAAALLEPGRYAMSDACCGAARVRAAGATPAAAFTSIACRPAAVAGDQGRRRARADGRGGRGRLDDQFEAVLRVPFTGRPSATSPPTWRGCSASSGRERVEVALVASGPERRQGASRRRRARHQDRATRCVLDFDGFVDGYGSDTTRAGCTSASRARSTPARVRDRARGPGRGRHRGGCSPGSPARRSTASARSAAIEASRLRPALRPRAPGHGIGLETHEPPFIVAGRDAAARARHVLFGPEPGIYVPGELGVADRGRRRRHRRDCAPTPRSERARAPRSSRGANRFPALANRLRPARANARVRRGA